jgi:hypothetical protein
MAAMDTTQTPATADTPGRVDELVERLAAVDPAAAPPLAEEIAAALTERLDGPAAPDGAPAGGAGR